MRATEGRRRKGGEREGEVSGEERKGKREKVTKKSRRCRAREARE